jgi:hypothetical protein
MEDDGILYGHLVQFTLFCYILWTFGIVRGNLVYFSPFWYFAPRKIWQPWLERPWIHFSKYENHKMLISARDDGFSSAHSLLVDTQQIKDPLCPKRRAGTDVMF